MTLRASRNLLYHTEDTLLRHPNLSAAVTTRTGGFFRSRLCSRSVTGFTGIFIADFDILLHTLNGVIKSDSNTKTDIVSLFRHISTPSIPSSSGESASEEIGKDIGHIHIAKIKTAKSRTCTGCGIGVEGGMTIGVIRLLLLRIRQNRIGFRSLPELCRSRLISGICIRVVFFCKLPICFLYGRLIGILVYPQYFVIITLFCHLDLSPYTSLKSPSTTLSSPFPLLFEPAFSVPEDSPAPAAPAAPAAPCACSYTFVKRA